MTTRIQKSTVPVETEIRVCDICKKDIERGHDSTCDMCDRDVHPPKKRDGCCQYDDDRESIVCRTCWELGKNYRKVVERCDEQRDAACTKWQELCDDHRYDDE